MTESAISKRKRRLIKLLKTYKWEYQYSVFPVLQMQNRDEDFVIASYALLEHDNKFRRKLREQFLDTAILFELRRLRLPNDLKTNYRKNFQQIYITFYSLKELDKTELNSLVESIYIDTGNLKSRQITDSKIESVVAAIQNQKLHSPIKRENGKVVNRFSLINKNLLVPVNSM